MIFQKCFGFSISNEAILLDDLVVLLVFWLYSIFALVIV
jgi:hypothetical protein